MLLFCRIWGISLAAQIRNEEVHSGRYKRKYHEKVEECVQILWGRRQNKGQRMAKKDKRGIERLWLTFENTVKMMLEENYIREHEDPPEDMYEEDDDCGQDERGMQKP